MFKLPPRWPTAFILSLLLLGSLPAISDTFSQESFKTHLRWNLALPKEQVIIQRQGATVTIDTLNLAIFEQISGEMAKMPQVPGYVDKVAYSQEGFPARPARITVTLKDASVELFSFYRDVEKKWIMDFWQNSDTSTRPAASAVTPVAPVVAKPLKAKPSKPIPPALQAPKQSLLEVIPVPSEPANRINPEFRDFRYGAAFVWDYPALLPPLERDILIESKVPEFLYPVKDRTMLDDPKEAHVQLSINLYRDNKWGLLNKSLDLYVKKYGQDANLDINEWLRVNALLKSNLTKKDRTLQASAMNILSNVMERTKNYELKRAAFRYLLQYQIDREDYFRSLELAKKFFVEARGEFDHDMVVLSANVILQSLARLRQVDKIAEFLGDKKLAALLPAQTELAYSTFALLSQGKSIEVVKRFVAAEKSLVKPIHPAILYNTAEAFFREAEYATALKTFDTFVADWAHMKEAAPARLRMALCYEYLDKPAPETIVLYKNAIDRSPYPEYRFEAKLRYVGMRLARKLNPSADDIETEIFLDQAVDEKKAMTPDLKKTLWLVRLRSFINRRKYDEALAYLTSLPIDTLRPADRRVFEGDGSEIVFGTIQATYLKEDYAKAVKLWELYKDKYEKKIAANPYLNFVISDAFIKLGLYQSFERAYSSLQGMREEELREFPVWVERIKDVNLKDMIEELALIKHIASKEWDQAEAKLASFPVSRRDSLNYPFYRGLVHFHLKKWQLASEEFERVLIQQNPKNRLTPRQMSELLMGYVESLYNLKDLERFKTVVKALALDMQRSKSASILNVAERVNFLLIESLAEDEKPEWNEVQELATTFGKRFPKSPYSGRIEYLLGLSLLRNGKMEEGKNVLQTLIGKASVPGYVREMARTELSALELKSKNL